MSAGEIKLTDTLMEVKCKLFPLCPKSILQYKNITVLQLIAHRLPVAGEERKKKVLYSDILRSDGPVIICSVEIQRSLHLTQLICR